jgi:hypothetical protein
MALSKERRQIMDIHALLHDFEDAAGWAIVNAAKARFEALEHAANVRGFKDRDEMSARRVLESWSVFDKEIGAANALQSKADSLLDAAYVIRDCLDRILNHGH